MQSFPNWFDKLRLPRPTRRTLAQCVSNIVEDAHWEWVRLLEDHRHTLAQVSNLDCVDVLPIEEDLALAPSRRRQFGESVQRPQQSRLAAARWPDQAKDLALAYRQGYALDCKVVAVIKAKVFGAHAL